MIAFHHIGMSVRDIAVARRFYEQAFDMAIIVEKPFSGGNYDMVMGLAGAAGLMAILESPGSSLRLELFQFQSPMPAPGDPGRRVCEYGQSHFCVQVEDVEAEYARLAAIGMAFHSPPVRFPGGNVAAYGRDPDGNVIELLQKLAA